MADDGSPQRRILDLGGRLLAGLSSLHPARLVFLGYLSYIAVGWFLLCLPISQRVPVGALDHLFIATSALSTTGLATVSVADSYTLFGQLVVLSLIQLGGIGYMTLGSFLILSRRSALSERRLEIGRSVFSLPASFRLEKFVVSVVRFTFAIELVGAAVLFVLLRRAGDPDPLWSAVFHSVSAFCTAGFSLYNASFESFTGHFWLNAALAALAYLGAIGFIVCVDFGRMMTGKSGQITLTSKIILWATFWLTLAGTALLFLAEPTIQSLPADRRLLASFFQCMTAMTTVGFNTVPIGALAKGSILLLVVLMIIGASPSGTGGGVKSTTVSAVLGVMMSAARGEHEVRFWGRTVPLERIWMAFASLGFYLVTLVVGTYLLELTEPSDFAANLFEAASALGTVGLSMGITAGLSNMGKIVVTLLMFLGRVGPLTFGTALLSENEKSPADDDLAV